MLEQINRPKDAITWYVIKDLLSRAERGVEKYNTTLEENNADDFLNHLYEELLDAAQYIKKEIYIRKNLQQMIAQYNNDTELGAEIRRTYAPQS